MTQEGFKRKLTAILSADVVGYSRLMDDNEEATVRTLNIYRDSMRALIQQHRGRVVDTTGDNLLAEFTSVVDALNCSVKVQRELAERNADLPPKRRMEFRIGVNVGDVIEEEDRIYGDGVNIAARVEALAEAGGICITGRAYDQVKNKLEFGYQYLGEHSVKNIPEPIRAYKVLMEPEAAGKVLGEKRKTKRWIALAAAIVLVIGIGGLAGWYFYLKQSKRIDPASLDRMAYTLPDKPSIAVLPFVNMSGDLEQEYFSDGITEDLITDLSKISGLFVIARNSAFIYKGKAAKIGEVGRVLGVRYVLEGSVRKANGRVRITAQLVDTTTEGHLWADRYDRDLKDIFALQDEVAQKIVAALEVKLTEDEQERLVRKYTDNMEAYDYYLRGAEYYYRFTKEANVQARRLFERAIELDSEFATAYALLGHTYLLDWAMEWNRDPHILEQAYEIGQKAIALDDPSGGGYCLVGHVYLSKKRHEKAIAVFERAIDLNANYPMVFAGLGDVLSWAGRPQEAIEYLKKAMRLDPEQSFWYFWFLGHAYFLAGQHEEAIETLKRAVNRNPDFWLAHVYLAASYSEIGRQEEARAEVSEFVRLRPQISSEDLRQGLLYKDQAVLERLFDSLRKAGLK
jgi:TolB-like protein/class 3 adenylate cyclase/cytochrome c-type biogenesis protein CcmH/NrfG